METAPEQQSKEPSLLERLRNCWEFASLMQYIFTFGKVVKIDEDFGIEDLEMECLKPGPSEKLLEIGLCLLKFVSSHRGLTAENFDEYTRRQYNAKAPHLPNPFGYDEQPKRFMDFDIFLKLKVLHQLSVWTFWNPERIREKMPEQREIDQTQWRIEELGYDREDRLYYVLDDNRLYRRTDPPIPPPPPPKPKANTKKARAAARAAKRRKLSEAAEAKEEEAEEKGTAPEQESHEDTSGGIKWECIAVTLADYQRFIDSIRNTRDPNEKILRDRLIQEVLPVIEKIEEAQQRKRQKQEKELLNMQLLASAKRSSRIADRLERERREREEAEAARRREAELAAARKEQERQRKLEEERQRRLMTREQRLKEREEKRKRHEAEMARLEEERKRLEAGESRLSERHLKAEMERQKKSLEELQEEHWFFDCSGCGVHGENLDDGTHSVACERCNVWQHSKCLGIPQDEAEKDDFHFICADCQRREEEAKRPKLPPLKFRIGSSASPSAPATNPDTAKEENQSPAKKVCNDASVEEAKPAAGPSLESSVPAQQPDPSPNGVQAANPPPSPQRRDQPVNGSSEQSSAPFAAPPSPSKAAVGPASSPSSHLPKSIVNQHQPQRPSSSHSTHSQAVPSPIQNRPSMSPTQGNRDVGPLAGFPPSALSNGSVISTPFGQHQAPRPQNPGFPPLSSSFDRHPSFSSAASGVNDSFSYTPPPQGSQGMSLSGLSPTKNSPRPMTSGSVGSASVLPPIQKLEPSPKLMGRSSPDAPIPPPVKVMTPEQEERRQRENEMMAREAANGQPSSLPHLTPWNLPPAQQQSQSAGQHGINGH
ncbi:DNA-directed RNA polymerase [Rasamsonia emersonii CBS 393.64]|uniref:DNA-directed RNA polymerase n=1 Tax=Rasamsonia emersonii (strain ATCC 16479 / CBS 393.64 / IMI 116815) TaxID=1408163 RepID=A0A0F4YT50_RASE3|nr:DNA-directed RNA polymerase [Rasamsonia emersonii CBS 393.64]KKA20798.1 DNA-directed RNA polymerase [Rasamsonia emersonii CBS 393.64]